MVRSRSNAAENSPARSRHKRDPPQRLAPAFLAGLIASFGGRPACVLSLRHAPAMPSAAFVLPRLFPLHPLAAALAHHCHRRGGDNKVVMRKSWRCRRWHCQRCDTSQGNQRCDHCAHVALQCASSECRYKREQRCHIPLFGLPNAILWALCAIAARVSRPCSTAQTQRRRRVVAFRYRRRIRPVPIEFHMLRRAGSTPSGQNLTFSTLI